MAFCFYGLLKSLNRSDLCGLHGLDLNFLSLKSIPSSTSIARTRFAPRPRPSSTPSISSISTAFSSMRSASRRCLRVRSSSVSKSVFVADKMQHDLGHPAGLAVFRALKDDVLHFAAAQRFCALFAQHPRDRVGNVGLAAAVRADDRRYAVSGKTISV